jgi:hypothetical protein
MDVTPCFGSSYSITGQSHITLGSGGSFDVTGTDLTPNLIRYVGSATPTSLQATITCASRAGPTGSLTANGSNYSMSGTFSFGNAPNNPPCCASQGRITVERRQ